MLDNCQRLSLTEVTTIIALVPAERPENLTVSNETVCTWTSSLEPLQPAGLFAESSPTSNSYRFYPPALRSHLRPTPSCWSLTLVHRMCLTQSPACLTFVFCTSGQPNVRKAFECLWFHQDCYFTGWGVEARIWALLALTGCTTWKGAKWQSLTKFTLLRYGRTGLLTQTSVMRPTTLILGWHSVPGAPGALVESWRADSFCSCNWVQPNLNFCIFCRIVFAPDFNSR